MTPATARPSLPVPPVPRSEQRCVNCRHPRAKHDAGDGHRCYQNTGRGFCSCERFEVQR